MSSEKKDTRFSTANKLLFGAWAIEILAALVSLLIGIFLIFGNTGLSAGELLRQGAIISGLLFIVLAVIELSRIPLIISIYRSGILWWQILGSIFLIIIMFVTFESMLVGFEINTSFMTSKQKNLMNEIEGNNEKIANLNNNINDITQLNEDTIRENFEKDLYNLSKLKNDGLNDINLRIELANKDRNSRLEETNERILNNNLQRDSVLKPIEEKKESLESKSNSQIQQNISDKIENLINTRGNLNNEKEKEIKRANTLFEGEKTNLDSNYANKENNIRLAVNSKNEEKRKDSINLKSLLSDIKESKGFGKGKARNNAIQTSKEKQKKLDNEIADLNKELTSLSDKKLKEQKIIRTKYENQLKIIDTTFQNRKKEMQKEIDILNNDLDKRIAIDQSAVKEDLEQTNQEIKRIREQYELEIKQINDERKDIQKLYASETSKLNSQIESINIQFEKDKNLLDEERKAKIEDLTLQTSKIDDLLSEKNSINDENANVKNNYNELATTSILHQFALKIPVWLYRSCGIKDADGNILPSQTPADITPDCLDFTETIWFGSLALVISITGTAVALGSEVLRSPPVSNNRTGSATLFLRILKYVRKPRIKKEIEIKIEKKIETVVKEVIKEIPVEKVVPTEVIKEKLVKQVVHIPVYTNDQALLNVSHNQKKDKDDKKK